MRHCSLRTLKVSFPSKENQTLALNVAQFALLCKGCPTNVDKVNTGILDNTRDIADVLLKEAVDFM